MKKIILIALAFLACIPLTAQFGVTCLPDGITFGTQEQIDSFQTNYPNCTKIVGDVFIGSSGPIPDISNLDSLNILTGIGGRLTIMRAFNLKDLAGFSNLIHIGGPLWIHMTDSLTNITGLNSVTSIGGFLRFHCNSSLSSLNGLQNIDTINGFIKIDYNNSLTSLSGLDNIVSVGESLLIAENGSLTNLTGLENVNSIGGELDISSNDVLKSIEGLENITSIQGNLIISNNDSLTSLSGLDNIDATSISELYIHDNHSLTTCEVQSVSDYLVSPNGSVNIYNNASGCNNPPEIAAASGNTFSCLPFGHYYFVNQSEIDNFQINYPGCNNLEGTVKIKGDNINNLYGLGSIISIDSKLIVRNNNKLVNLSGLENLTSIGEELEVNYNNNLVNITGLNNLVSVAGISIYGNDSMRNFAGLETVDSINGFLKIQNNASLSDLTGLENLAYAETLWINGNDSLSCLEGLDKLTIVGYVRILDNKNLTNLTGMENLEYIQGTLWIEGNNLLPNFAGLENLDSIGGSLRVEDNDSLVDLTGLEGLVYIAGSLNIGNGFLGGNPSLSSLKGLENLTSIGGSISIGDEWYGGNPVLTSLQSLENLVSIGGIIQVEANGSLTSIAGLDNIDASTIQGLFIQYNNSLSECEVQSICNYLVAPNGEIEIKFNFSGCTNKEEVVQACETVSVGEYGDRGLGFCVQVYPNPFFNSTTIAYELQQPSTVQITIYNHLGNQLEIILQNQSVGKQQLVWNAEGLPAGVYFGVLRTKEGTKTLKMIKLK